MGIISFPVQSLLKNVTPGGLIGIFLTIIICKIRFISLSISLPLFSFQPSSSCSTSSPCLFSMFKEAFVITQKCFNSVLIYRVDKDSKINYESPVVLILILHSIELTTTSTLLQKIPVLDIFQFLFIIFYQCGLIRFDNSREILLLDFQKTLTNFRNY